MQLSPEFSDSVYEYTVEVDYAMDTLRIKPTADSKYTIAINDQEAENGAYYELPIKVGYNDEY